MTSVARLLLDEPTLQARRQRLSERLTAMGRVPPAIRVGGVDIDGVEVTNALADLLELPVGNIALRAWSARRELAEAKERTAGDPTARETVRLLEHTIESTHTPTVEVTAAGLTKTVLELELVVELTIASAAFVVQGGQVVESRAAQASGKVELSGSGVTLFERELPAFDLETAADLVDIRDDPPVPASGS